MDIPLYCNRTEKICSPKLTAFDVVGAVKNLPILGGCDMKKEFFPISFFILDPFFTAIIKC